MINQVFDSKLISGISRRTPASSPVRPGGTSRGKWRAIYALARPDELYAEAARLDAAAAMAVDCKGDMLAEIDLRKALVRERLADLNGA